jgi:pyridoxamine 5'-phosphate oxidase
MEIIKLNNINNSKPYQTFTKYYNEALENGQKHIQAISISSYNKSKNEVDCRYVNLKSIDDDEWAFFTNYSSKKASDFKSHKQISATIFWDAINVQIRMKAFIQKIDNYKSDNYFKNRSVEKNALAISSNQSSKIESYELVKAKYEKTLLENKCKSRPQYWGGYSFKPYFFEFWRGDESRINYREIFEFDGYWSNCILEP